MPEGKQVHEFQIQTGVTEKLLPYKEVVLIVRWLDHDGDEITKEETPLIRVYIEGLVDASVYNIPIPDWLENAKFLIIDNADIV